MIDCMHRPAILIARSTSCSARCGSSGRAAWCRALAWALLLTVGHAARARANAPCDTIAKACPRALQSETARGLALGTGVRASAISTSALAYNPAALVAGRAYHVEGLVDYMADLQTVALGGAVVDSSTSRLAAGLSLRGFVSGENGMGGIDGRLGIAFPLSDAISLGLSGRYLNVSQSVLLIDGSKPSLSLVKGFTMDASIRIAPTPAVQLEVGSYNLIRLSGQLGAAPGAPSLAGAYAPLVIGGGASAVLGDMVVIGADVLVDLTSYSTAATTVGGGAEVLLANVLPLRAGYSYDVKRTQNTLSLGVGYADRSVGFDLTWKQDLGGLGDTRVAAAFRFFVH
jgi:hypothetical protein